MLVKFNITINNIHLPWAKTSIMLRQPLIKYKKLTASKRRYMYQTCYLRSSRHTNRIGKKQQKNNKKNKTYIHKNQRDTRTWKVQWTSDFVFPTSVSISYHCDQNDGFLNTRPDLQGPSNKLCNSWCNSVCI